MFIGHTYIILNCLLGMPKLLRTKIKETLLDQFITNYITNTYWSSYMFYIKFSNLQFVFLFMTRKKHAKVQLKTCLMKISKLFLFP